MTPLPSASTSCRQISFKPVLLLHAAIPKSSILQNCLRCVGVSVCLSHDSCLDYACTMPVLNRFEQNQYVPPFHNLSMFRVVLDPNLHNLLEIWRNFLQAGLTRLRPKGEDLVVTCDSPCFDISEISSEIPSEAFPKDLRPSANLPWAQLVSAIRHLKTHLYRWAFHIGVEPWKDTMPRLG